MDTWHRTGKRSQCRSGNWRVGSVLVLSLGWGRCQREKRALEGGACRACTRGGGGGGGEMRSMTTMKTLVVRSILVRFAFSMVHVCLFPRREHR